MSPKAIAARTFRSLRIRNYRLYFWGQVVSLSGTWLQSVALAWLVLELTGSGFHLGLVVAAQFAPMLVAGPWGGVIADRADKRRLLVFTQFVSATLAVALGTIVVLGGIELWMVYAFSLAFGLVNLVDLPARGAFVAEMVGREDVANATSLNGVVMNASRVIGPAFGGLLIATVGIGWCFIVNAATFLACNGALWMMRPDELYRSEPTPRARGQLREGLRYTWSKTELRTPLIVMTLVGMLAFNFSIVLPLMAEHVFHGGAGAFSAMFSVFGIGAVVGGLAFAAGGRADGRMLAASSATFGVLIWLLALAPSLGWALVVLVPLGAVASAFIATASSMLQLASRPSMRGRVMSLFMLVFVGTTPLGGPLVGWIAERFGPRASLGVGGTATVLAGVIAYAALRNVRRHSKAHPDPEVAATLSSATA